MARSAQEVMDIFPGPDPATTGALALAPAPRFSGDLLPATKAQVEHWRRLCGAVSEMGVAGMHDHEWSPELAPAKLTTRELVARGIFVRRSRAWHLKRG